MPSCKICSLSTKKRSIVDEKGICVVCTKQLKRNNYVLISADKQNGSSGESSSSINNKESIPIQSDGETNQEIIQTLITE